MIDTKTIKNQGPTGIAVSKKEGMTGWRPSKTTNIP